MTGNLGPRERRKRMIFGAVMLVIAFVLTNVLVAAEVGRGWRLLLFAPFALAAHGLFQARAGT